MTTNKLSTNSKKNKNDFFTSAIFTIIIFGIMLVIISDPKRYNAGTIAGLKLFFNAVLPGLFPFMLLTKLLTELGFLFKITPKFDKFSKKLFGTSGISIYAFLMSIISGYPIGAKIIADLYEKNMIDETEAKKMSIFCTTSGPVFVIGTVGTAMLKSFKLGVIIYLSHIISSVLMGIIYNLLTKKHMQKNNIAPQDNYTNSINSNILSECINQTINSLFIVASYITIFYLFGEILDAFHVLDFITKTLSKITAPLGINAQALKGTLYGILEVTRGANELSKNITPMSIMLCSGIISFSGISINLQMLSFLKTAKIKAHNFILTKCVHMILSIFVCMLIFFIWK